MMNPDELAKTVAKELSPLAAHEIYPWLHAFTSTHPYKTVEAVNLVLLDDPSYKDAISRMVAWREDHAGTSKMKVSWLHVTSETEASLRLAASWRSSSLTQRDAFQNHATPHLGSHSDTLRAQAASTQWGDYALLNYKGVALKAPVEPSPWTGETGDIVSVMLKLATREDTYGNLGYIGYNDVIVLCEDGRVIKSLPTWPRG